MLTENDLRDALQDPGQPRRSLSAEAIVRRGHRRRVIVQSATGASVLGVVGIIGVTGLSLSDGSSPAAGGNQPGALPAAQPAAQPSPSVNAKPAPVVPVATGSQVAFPAASAFPSASAFQSMAASQPVPPAPDTVLPAGTPHTITSIPFGGGTVAYSLRPEPYLHNANGILLDVARADGSLTIRVDGGIPANATRAVWWYGSLGSDSTDSIVYGAVPAGATHVRLYVDGKPLEVSTTPVAGATALAFTLIDHDAAQTPGGQVSKLTYVDAAGATVTALAATSSSQG